MAGESLDDVVRKVIGHDRTHVISEYRALALELAAFPPVLDLGCGAGTLLETLRQSGVEARGVDSSASAIAACREREIPAEHADAIDFLSRAPNTAYGAVFAGHLIEHLPPAAAERVFAEVARVLRPGGRFVLLTPNPRNLYVASEGFWIDPTHIRPYPEPLLRALAANAGFSAVRVRSWGRGMPVRQLVSGAVRWLLTAGLHHIAPSLLCVATK